MASTESAPQHMQLSPDVNSRLSLAGSHHGPQKTVVRSFAPDGTPSDTENGGLPTKRRQKNKKQAYEVR